MKIKNPFYYKFANRNVPPKHENDLYHVVVPLGEEGGASADPSFYDDCPICQDLKKRVESGDLHEREEL